MYGKKNLRRMRPLQRRLGVLSNEIERSLTRLKDLGDDVAELEEEMSLWEADDSRQKEEVAGTLRTLGIRLSETEVTEVDETHHPPNRRNGPKRSRNKKGAATRAGDERSPADSSTIRGMVPSGHAAPGR